MDDVTVLLYILYRLLLCCVYYSEYNGVTNDLSSIIDVKQDLCELTSILDIAYNGLIFVPIQLVRYIRHKRSQLKGAFRYEVCALRRKIEKCLS